MRGKSGRTAYLILAVAAIVAGLILLKFVKIFVVGIILGMSLVVGMSLLLRMRR